MPGAASERSLPPVPAPAPSLSGTELSEKVHWVSGQELGLATPPRHTQWDTAVHHCPSWLGSSLWPSTLGVHTWDTCGGGKPAHA